MVTFLFRFSKEPIHTKFRVFSGPDREHLAYCGYVCMRHEEWDAFRAIVGSKPNVFITETKNFLDDIDQMGEEGFIEVEGEKQ